MWQPQTSFLTVQPQRITAPEQLLAMSKINELGIDESRRNKVPRPVSDSERTRLEEFVDNIHYSAR